MRALAILALLIAGAYALWRSANADAAESTTVDAAPNPLSLVADGASSLLEQLGGGLSTSSGSWALPAAGQAFADEIRAAEVRYSLPENLLARLLYQESRFRPEIIDGSVRSSTGAIGIAQFMPATAAELSVDPTDPHASIKAAAKMLRRLYDKFGDWSSALAAYNWGEGNVARKGIAQLPEETAKYVAEISADVSIA
jgi:soluble lytic murein transglycosylase-like protein